MDIEQYASCSVEETWCQLMEAMKTAAEEIISSKLRTKNSEGLTKSAGNLLKEGRYTWRDP